MVEEFVFPTRTDSSLLFPKNGFGTVLLSRRRLVEGALRSILESRETHYWRGPPGSGKTVFLQLLGRELQKHGEVYWLGNAGYLTRTSDDTFKCLAKKGAEKGRDVFLIIDEVQDNPNSPCWTYLLKNYPSNLITIGAGIATLENVSAPFAKKHPSPDSAAPPPLSLTREDVNELAAYWVDRRLDISASKISEILMFLLQYTGGHFFPLARYSEHIFTSVLPIWDVDFVRMYISGFEFARSSAFISVFERCFNTLSTEVKSASIRIFEGNLATEDAWRLDKAGYWNNATKWFLSDLFVVHVFKAIPLVSTAKIDAKPTVLDVLVGGLTCMRDDDFEEPFSGNSRYEDGIGFSWGWNVKKEIPSLYVCPQTQVLKTSAGVKSSLVDFYFNGNLNLAVELARNRTPAQLAEKLDKFQAVQKCRANLGKSGAYACWPNFAVLHFQLYGKEVVFPSAPYKDSDFFFTYHKPTNTLYQGRNVVRINVCRGVPSMPQPTLAKP